MSRCHLGSCSRELQEPFPTPIAHAICTWVKSLQLLSIQSLFLQMMEQSPRPGPPKSFLPHLPRLRIQSVQTSSQGPVTCCHLCLASVLREHHPTSPGPKQLGFKQEATDGPAQRAFSSLRSRQYRFR
jgi:hypothetical protein